MKGGVAMMLAAFMRAQAGGAPPPGDVILCVLADEEAGSELGASFLVQRASRAVRRRPLRDRRVRRLHAARSPGARFYPIMVAEKQVCWTRATHPRRAPATARCRSAAARWASSAGCCAALDSRRLPVHVTPVARSMVEAIAAELPRPLALPLRALLVPALTDRVLDVLGERGRMFDPLLHNTASVTMVGGRREDQRDPRRGVG